MLLTIPHSLIIRILYFLDDIDLLVFQNLNSICYILANDSYLWKCFFRHKYPSQLIARLSNSNRPNRHDLVHRNILRAASNSHLLHLNIQQGAYISGPFSVHSYQVGILMRNLRNKRLLSNLLLTRPTLKELSQRNLIPLSTTISPQLHSQILKLTKHFQKRKINNQLANRRSVDQLAQAGIVRNHTTSNAIVSIQFSLTPKLLSKYLRHHLSHRSDIADIEARKIICDDSYLAAVMCPSVKPKIQFYEAL
ncbi:hypothetical protein BC833DRAFT_602233 [Globomyces pollinis-pini]|nr:hypothetical protein BC833DRAFT_602233 [Globomyces pollinis-pini]